MIDTSDAMEMLAGLPSGSPLTALRRQRPDVVTHTQGSDEAIFTPTDDGGLSRAERLAAALRAANVLSDIALAEHYRNRLMHVDPSGALARTTDPDAAPGDRRWAAALAHVDRVTTDPDSAQRSDLDGLAAAGLSPHAIVSLSQVIAFVNFQARVVAGLRMLRDAS